MIRSYLPALVFVGLGAILGLIFVTANSLLGPQAQPARALAGATPTSAACRRRCRRTSASGSPSTSSRCCSSSSTSRYLPVSRRAPAQRVRDVRARRDDRLHRAAVRRLRLRVAKGGARMEVTRARPRAPGGMQEFRARQLRARDMLRGDLEGARARASTSSSPCSPRRSTRSAAGRSATPTSRSRSASPAARSSGCRTSARASTSRASASRPPAPRRARPTRSSCRAASRSRWRRSSGASGSRCSSRAT